MLFSDEPFMASGWWVLLSLSRSRGPGPGGLANPAEGQKPYCAEHRRSGAKALPLVPNLAQGGAVILGRWNSPR